MGMMRSDLVAEGKESLAVQRRLYQFLYEELLADSDPKHTGVLKSDVRLEVFIEDLYDPDGPRARFRLLNLQSEDERSIYMLTAKQLGRLAELRRLFDRWEDGEIEWPTDRPIVHRCPSVNQAVGVSPFRNGK